MRNTLKPVLEKLKDFVIIIDNEEYVKYSDALNIGEEMLKNHYIEMHNHVSDIMKSMSNASPGCCDDTDDLLSTFTELINKLSK